MRQDRSQIRQVRLSGLSGYTGYQVIRVIPGLSWLLPGYPGCLIGLSYQVIGQISAS
jgi:hypothetical protein